MTDGQTHRQTDVYIQGGPKK